MHGLTSLLISSCLSGAERAVALIMVDVWLSVSFLMQRWPATMLQTCAVLENSLLVKQGSLRRGGQTQWVKRRWKGHKSPQSHLQGKVGVLLFLADLQAGQMWILELQVVLLLEILRDGALHGLSVL